MKRANNIVDVDSMMDERFGAVRTEARNEFRKEAYNYYVGRLILEARRQERLTQSDLASKIGASKSYISRIEKGQVEPGVGTFLRILEALGLRFEVVRPLSYSLAVHSAPHYVSDVDAPTYGSGTRKDIH